MTIDLLDYQKPMERDGIIFCYKGVFSQNLLPRLGQNLRNKIRGETDNRTLSIKIFSVFIEMIQNVNHYALTKNDDNIEQKEETTGIIVVGKHHDQYFVSCGNEIRHDQKAIVEERLASLQQMNNDEIKAYFRKQRKSTPHAESKGGGIGLIEIAKLASEPIEYKITSINEKTAFYSLTVII